MPASFYQLLQNLNALLTKEGLLWYLCCLHVIVDGPVSVLLHEEQMGCIVVVKRLFVLGVQIGLEQLLVNLLSLCQAIL